MGPTSNHVRRGSRGWSGWKRKRQCDRTETGVLWPWTMEGCHHPTLEEVRDWLLPYSLQRRHRNPPGFLLPDSEFGLPTSADVSGYISVVFSHQIGGDPSAPGNEDTP